MMLDHSHPQSAILPSQAVSRNHFLPSDKSQQRDEQSDLGGSNITGVALRPWQHSDLEPCMSIWRAASEIGHPFLSRDDLDADAELMRTLCIPGSAITVAEANGHVLGFITRVGAFIGGLFVDPAVHRRGIGRRLLAHTEKVRKSLTTEVYVDNHRARAFYRSLGYREVLCQLFDDQGRPHPLVRMTSAEDTASILPSMAIPRRPHEPSRLALPFRR